MKKITKYIMILGVLLIVGLTGVRCAGQYRMQQQLAEKILRFHVQANSDSAEDQALKLQVRDAVGGYMQEKMQNLRSKGECESYIAEKISEIERVAEQVVANAGFSYEVQAELTECEFPVTSYGRYTFPEGDYDALRVTIGAGRGQNWWCVMYPNMCFANSMYEVVDEKNAKTLQAVLEEEEYQMVLNSGNYEVRFWLLELFK